MINNRTYGSSKSIRVNAAPVKVIPAQKKENREKPAKARRSIRVAGYCRVSTNEESQKGSFASQEAYLRSLIMNHPGWELVDIYKDENCSGTSRAHRDGFNRMMRDAKAGKMDYIITKSISRFARNTVDSLDCVHELKGLNPPVGVFFEKEQINTLEDKCEMVLTILSCLAQNESLSISENICWGVRRKFRLGIPQINLNRMLGYDMTETGEWIINQKQAETVRYIYERFVAGESANKIASELNCIGQTTVNGNKWTASSVLIILRNEKYVGDLAMQKTFTKDYLSHRAAPNRGEMPMYYIDDHHEPIVNRLLWNKAQAILRRNRREDGRTAAKSAHPFSDIRYGENGEKLSRMTYTATATGYTDERSLQATGDDTGDYLETYSFSFPVWRGKTTSGENVCYHEVALEQSFMEMLYRLKYDDENHGENSEIRRLFADISATEEQNNNFTFFLGCLKNLPPKNEASSTPEMLLFDRGVYCAFVKSGIADGDWIVYQTNFGVSLITDGNQRTLDDFAGCRRYRTDGTAVEVNANYQVYDYQLQYRRWLSAAGKRRKGAQNEIGS